MQGHLHNTGNAPLGLRSHDAEKRISLAEEVVSPPSQACHRQAPHRKCELNRTCVLLSSHRAKGQGSDTMCRSTGEVRSCTPHLWLSGGEARRDVIILLVHTRAAALQGCRSHLAILHQESFSVICQAPAVLHEEHVWAVIGKQHPLLRLGQQT